MAFLEKIFGNQNEKYIKQFQLAVEKINLLEKEFEGFASDKLKEKTREFKEEFKKGKNIDDLLVEAFALAREASKRTLGQRPFDSQLIGGMVLHQGKIAEMMTGEGKTLAATLPLYLNALEGRGCHLVTVNDYLAKRDMVWMGQIYHALGLSVGCITHEASYLYDPAYGGEQRKNTELDEKRDVVGGFKVVEEFLRPCTRREAYAADITYGTNNEFGFDYLRDNMVYSLKDKSQRDFNFAIVDEVDSILIDEARTPLIISAPDTESSKWYQEFSRIIPKLNPETDFEIDEKLKSATLTEPGIEKIEKILGMANIYEEKGIKYLHHLEQALRAQTLFKLDKDYVVKNNEVIIIDEFTGRLLPGRRWSGGLHQAMEAKEGVFVQPESLTLASVTFQNYFRMYKKLSGMTGTAMTSAEEFFKVYKLEVVAVPPNKPLIRRDLSDKVFKSETGKFKALVQTVKEKYEKGQPVLVGTRSVEKNEFLGKLLEREGLPIKILNAKHHEQEGEIIAQAGKFKAITIATNMAGRGVDIILGGNPPDPQNAQKVRQAGGLAVIGTERHEARRIDNQLRGRSGRQGDPAETQFFLSLEDDLMRLFGGDKIKGMMEFLKIPEDEPIEAGLVSRALEEAQAKVEGFNFDARNHVLEYDDVINKHRETIYRKRKEILEEDFHPRILEMLEKQDKLLRERSGEDVQYVGLGTRYEEKEKEFGQENLRQIEKIVALRTIDGLWIEHLENLESLQDAVRLRAYGQQDPLIEFKKEAHQMFQSLLLNIESLIVNTLLSIKAQPAPSSKSDFGGEKSDFKNGFDGAKVGRNDPCPCGAKKPDGQPIKFKHCHGV